MSTTADQSAAAEAVRREIRRDHRVEEVADLAANRGVVAYVVGGLIRDVILGRSCADIDVAVEGAADIGREFSARVRGTFVSLHEEHQVARVVVNERTYDFADLRGDSIADDLALRDFTLNAIACPLPATDANGTELVDPLRGMVDLRERTIRAASDTAMRDDPVRTVRAFRFAAELGFTIDKHTSALIADAAERLTDVAGERIQVELFKILAAPHAAPLVHQMDELGVLPALLPQLAKTKGVPQDARHHLDVWDHSLATLDQVEEITRHLDRYFPGYAREMESYLARDATVAVLKLSALLHDVAKAGAPGEDGRTSPASHSSAGAQVARDIANRLRLSRRDRQALVGFVRHHPRPLELLSIAGQGELRARAMARYFRATGHHSVGLLLLALAHGKAMLGPAQAPDWQTTVTQFVRRLLDFYFDEYVPKEKLPRLLTGRDLLDEFSLSPGPELGEMLDALQDAQTSGQIQTRDAARAFVRKRLREQRQDKDDG
jgi:poly(A) polymerase